MKAIMAPPMAAAVLAVIAVFLPNAVLATLTYSSPASPGSPVSVSNYDFPVMDFSVTGYSFTSPMLPLAFVNRSLHPDSPACLINTTYAVPLALVPPVVIINTAEAIEAGCQTYGDVAVLNGWMEQAQPFKLAIFAIQQPSTYCCVDIGFGTISAQYLLDDTHRFSNSKVILTGISIPDAVALGGTFMLSPSNFTLTIDSTGSTDQGTILMKSKAVGYLAYARLALYACLLMVQLVSSGFIIKSEGLKFNMKWAVLSTTLVWTCLMVAESVMFFLQYYSKEGFPYTTSFTLLTTVFKYGGLILGYISTSILLLVYSWVARTINLKQNPLIAFMRVYFPYFVVLSAIAVTATVGSLIVSTIVKSYKGVNDSLKAAAATLVASLLIQVVGYAYYATQILKQTRMSGRRAVVNQKLSLLSVAVILSWCLLTANLLIENYYFTFQSAVGFWMYTAGEDFGFALIMSLIFIANSLRVSSNSTNASSTTALDDAKSPSAQLEGSPTSLAADEKRISYIPYASPTPEHEPAVTAARVNPLRTHSQPRHLTGLTINTTPVNHVVPSSAGANAGGTDSWDAYASTGYGRARSPEQQQQQQQSTYATHTHRAPPRRQLERLPSSVVSRDAQAGIGRGADWVELREAPATQDRWRNDGQQGQRMSSGVATPATLEAVSQALESLYSPTSAGSAIAAADAWLTDFQKKPEAWAVADVLIQRDNRNHQIFAAQTFRKKIKYDLGSTSPRASKLRDTLLSLLVAHRNSPPVVTDYLYLSLADLAILMRAGVGAGAAGGEVWEDPIGELGNAFVGQGAAQVGGVVILLGFLASLPEELEDMGKIGRLKREELNKIRAELMTSRVEDVMRMLMIIQTQMEGLVAVVIRVLTLSLGDKKVQDKILDCIYSWLYSGDLKVDMVANMGVVDRAFELLADPDLFDRTVDLITEIIRRSGNSLHRDLTPGTQKVIHDVYQGLVRYLPHLRSCGDDEDTLRGLTRIFAEAGDSYYKLIAEDLPTWQSLLDGLLLCAASTELEIVGITLRFWTTLQEVIDKREDLRALFAPVFSTLMDTLLRHLQYPPDDAFTPKQRDIFREFRHDMGDVLKSCVCILGQREALARPYRILTSFAVTGAAAGAALDPAIPWQSIEAPLFAVRTMGREISIEENEVLPEIMSMLPRLPDHPKVRHSAIMLIGRYATWTKMHPEFLPYQMTFVSKGFEDVESVSAASRALRYLCEESGELIVNYLSQLHPFYLNIVKVVEKDERRDIVTALARVISHVPVQSPDASHPDMLKVLEMFCLPIAQQLHALSLTKFPTDKDAKRDVEKEACALLDQFNIFLRFARPANVPSTVIHPCLALFQNMWPVFSSLLDQNSSSVTTDIAKILTTCARSYPNYFGPTVNDVLPRIAAVYDAGEVSALVWAAAHFVDRFGDERGPNGPLMYSLVESMSNTTFRLVHASSGNIDANWQGMPYYCIVIIHLYSFSAVVEDYFLLLFAFTERCPTLLLRSPLLPHFFNCGLACMPVQQPDAFLTLHRMFFRSLLQLASPTWRKVRMEIASVPVREGLPARAARRPPPPPDPSLLEPLMATLKDEEAGGAGGARRLLAGLITALIYTAPPRYDLRYGNGGDGDVDDEEGSCIDRGAGDGGDSYVVGGLVVAVSEAMGVEFVAGALARAVVELPEQDPALEGLPTEREDFVRRVVVEVEKGAAREVEKCMDMYVLKYRRRNHDTLKANGH
ncbi:Nuclear import receptor [Irineochytrium annulatum]|nr:Nuclear import receptor [Irineochytrium annulatum]